MNCETGNCPTCRIRVGATPTPFNLPNAIETPYTQTYHLFLLYHDRDRDIVYRGGPASGSTYGRATELGLATTYSAPTSETFDIDWPFDNLITSRQEGLGGNHDYVTWQDNGAQESHLITIAEGAEYCGLDAQLTEETRRIGELGRTYNAVDVDRIDNSNATVYTILEEAGLPLQKPDIIAPGWGTNLHTETTLPEEIGAGIDRAMEPVREVQRQFNWFDSLPAMDQYNILRRMFP